MNRIPPYIARAREIQQQVGESREKFAAVFQDIYAGTTNFQEELVPAYDIPSPLTGADGKRVCTAVQWMNFRRREVLELFEKEIYGSPVPRPERMRFEVLSEKEDALKGKAVRREVRICCYQGEKFFSFDLLLYLPKHITRPVGAFIGLNFKGNHGCTAETDVLMTPSCFNDGQINAVTSQTPEFFAEKQRGVQAYRWCFEEIIDRGYAAATICYEDIFPDTPDGWQTSCFSLWGDWNGYNGAHEKYSAIGAWAWGLSRGMDYLESVPQIDREKVFLHGHSRLGKTALWTGALDTRFAMVISNDSGCLGAALSRRMFGENFFILVNYRPHWFVKNARKYINREYEMPFDQHWLISLAAPRPVAVASAWDDHGADPRGEFLSALWAGEVYALFGSQGLPCHKMPIPGQFVTGDISYHIRAGRHDQTPEDWAHYLEIADKLLCQREQRDFAQEKRRKQDV